MGRERRQVAGGVREQPQLQALRAQRLENRQGVVVQLEMLRLAPGGGHLDGGAARVSAAAHPLHDPLGEEHPDLLVVVELRVPLETPRSQRGAPRRSGRVEVEPVPRPSER